jgi:MFS family permease
MFTLLGIVAGQVATPILLQSGSLGSTMMFYGILGAVSALLFLLFARDHPPTPAGHEEKALMLDGLKHILSLRDFYLLAFIFFVINGIFNGIATLVEVMVRPRGLDIDQAGLIGGLLILGGMLGFVVFSSISDRIRKRKPPLIAAALLSIPFLILMAYVNGFAGLAVVSFLLGLSVMGGMPVVFQYLTEIGYPTPEGTSQGLLNIGGQVSVVAIDAMQWSNRVHGSFAPSLIVFAIAMAVGALLVSMMKESKLIQAAK